MSKKKEVNYYKEYYLGTLSEETAEALIQIKELDSQNKEIPALKNCIWNVDEDEVNNIKNYAMRNYKQPEIDYENTELGELEPSQTTGVAFMYTAKSCLVGDSTGYGKTIETAGLINVCRIEYEKRNKEFFYIFLTDKTAIEEIQDKLITRTGEYVHSITGQEKDINKWIEITNRGIWCSVVASHSALQNTKFFKWIQLNKNNISLLVLDESAVIKKTSSEIHKNIKSLTGVFDRFIMLNATPIETKLLDFYNQLNLLDKNFLPTIEEFESEFCVKGYLNGRRFPQIIKHKNENLFKSRIGLRYIARTRKQIHAKFENNSGDILLSELSKEQKYLIKRTTMWRQVCDCPQVFDTDIPFDKDFVPKLGDIEYILEEMIPKNEPVLIYCYYRKEIHLLLQEYLEGLGYSTEIINGETKSQKRRKNIIDEFNKGNIKILVTNIFRAIDLKGCNNIILYSFDFNPTKMIQVEGRITREFDIINKHIYLLCSEGMEFKYLKQKIAKRVELETTFTNQDYSIISDIILNILKLAEESVN